MNGLGDATNGVADDATDELDRIKADVQRWRAKTTERWHTLQAKALASELDSWLNFMKRHAVLSKSKHDMLQTYKFLCYSGPAETKLRRPLRA